MTDNFMTMGALNVLLHQGPGAFAPAQQYSAGVATDGSLPTGVTVGDFDGNGKLDLAVANQAQSFQNSVQATVGIFLNRGDGTFAPQVTYPVGHGPWAVAVAVGDFDGDGRSDVAVVNAWDGTVDVLLDCR